jgi:hypothetical protein
MCTLQVVSELLKLHAGGAALRDAARKSGLQLGDMLLHQLQYIAAHRTRLSTAVQQLCCKQLWLLSSSGELQRQTSNIYLAPADADTLQILQELSSLGSSVSVLDACYAPIWKDAESRPVLTTLLGLTEADAETAVSSMVAVHSSSKAEGSPVSGQQLLMHLQYLARHKDLLEDDDELCEHVRQAVVLQDTNGTPAAATELFFPLAAEFAQGLQQDMHAAGMRTLHSSFAATHSASSSGSSANSSHTNWLLRLLELLGVRTAGPKTIVQHILRLYSGSKGQAAVSEQQRMAHLAFLADHIRLLEDDRSLLQQVRGALQLQDSSSVYRAPCKLHHALDTELASLQPDMLAAGMHFLHSSYTAAAAVSDTQATQSRLHTLLQLLGVAKATPLVVAKHILQLYKPGRDSAGPEQEEHIRHLTFFANHLAMLQHNSSLLQQVQQHVLLLDSSRTQQDLAKKLQSCTSAWVQTQLAYRQTSWVQACTSYTTRTQLQAQVMLSPSCSKCWGSNSQISLPSLAILSACTQTQPPAASPRSSAAGIWSSLQQTVSYLSRIAACCSRCGVRCSCRTPAVCTGPDASCTMLLTQS